MKAFLLFVSLFAVTARSNPVCSFVLGRLNTTLLASSNEATQRQIAEDIVRLLVEYAGTLAPGAPAATASAPYTATFIPRTRSESQSFHQPAMADGMLVNRRWVQVYRDKVGTRFILELPEAAQRTVWGELSPIGREQLILALQSVMRAAPYDKNAYENFESAAARFRDAGISPWLVFKGAHEKKLAGACVHANCTLAGMLGELGAEGKSVRLSIGQTLPFPGAGRVHFFGSIASQPRGSWKVFDATPLLGGDDLPPEVLAAIRQRNPEFSDFLSAEIERLYIYFKKDIPDFLQPGRRSGYEGM